MSWILKTIFSQSIKKKRVHLTRTYYGNNFIGIQGLCILLRRLAYPDCNLSTLFCLSTSYLSLISNEFMKIIFNNKGNLLKELQLYISCMKIR